MTTTTTVTLRGHIVGPIWMPTTDCWKPVEADSESFERSTGERPTARDLALRATEDGDFMHCRLTADSEFEFERVTRSNGSVKVLHRRVPVTAFPSIADCVDERESWEMGEGED
jgi:hypothetical protein